MMPQVKRITHLMRRAAQAGPVELHARARRALFTGYNFVRSTSRKSAFSPSGHLRALKLKPGELNDWWRSRSNSWFVDVNRDIQLQNAKHIPETGVPWVLEQADLVMGGRMPIFSHEPVEFVGRSRWHRDFILDKSADRRFYGFIPYLDADIVGDAKHIWEPNRFGWAFWLGVAHRMSMDQKYAEKFAELTRDWFSENPYPFGINYCSALELAFRNYAWIWSLSFFAEYLRKDTELLNLILKGLWLSCRHIETNLSTYFAPNTHVTGEAFGLFVTGAAIPEFSDAPRWRNLGTSILETESRRQFHEDGTHRELSSGYHIYSSEFYLHTALVAQKTGFQIPNSVVATSRQLAARLTELAPNNLEFPQFNDCDGGRLVSLVPNALDAGPTIMTAHALFGDEIAAPQDVPLRGYSLLMGPRTPTAQKHQPTPKTQVAYGTDISDLYDSGLVAHRNQEGDYLLFRATPFGYDDCPHSHDAGLGIILYLAGTPIFVDSGVGSYTQQESIRNEFRSAVGKNTILINQQGPSTPKGWFTWQQSTDCELISLERFPDGFTARGKHHGYSVSPMHHVFVQREVVMLDTGIIAIVDRWDADIEVSVRTQFTVSPEVILDTAHQVLQTKDGGTTVHFRGMALEGTAPIRPVKTRVAFSANYGLHAQADAIGFESIQSKRGGIVTILSRVGEIQDKHDSTQTIVGTANVLLRLTKTGVEPIRTDSSQTAVLTESR